MPGKERLSQQFRLPPPDSKQPPKQPSQSLIESKSVTWATSGLSEPPRSILKKDHEHDYGYDVVCSESVIASTGGYGA